ncbi:MAG: hypothetical protein ACHP7D_01740 [Lysobacterales bacterium]
MSLSDLASIGSLVSSIAVLISLIYLALQVRQAERNQQAAIRQGRATRVVDIILAAGDPSCAEALPKGTVGAMNITPAEFGQFTAIYGAFLASAEDTFLQYNERLLSEAVFASFSESWRRTLAQPGVRALWKLRRHGFEAGFVAFMDGLMVDAPAAAGSDFFAAWKAEVETQKTRQTAGV